MILSRFSLLYSNTTHIKQARFKSKRDVKPGDASAALTEVCEAMEAGAAIGSRLAAALRQNDAKPGRHTDTLSPGKILYITIQPVYFCWGWRFCLCRYVDLSQPGYIAA